MSGRFRGIVERRAALEQAEAARYAGKFDGSGKLSPRQRLARLFDGGLFEELGRFERNDSEPSAIAGDGVITAVGRVDGQLVYAYSQDYTFLGGSLGQVQARKIVAVQDLALAHAAPVVALIESGGARIQEGIDALDGYGRIFSRNVASSGAVAQIAVIFGSCAGGASYAPALMDFIVMVEGRSRMFVTGPDVIRAVTGEAVSFEDLGGSAVHSGTSGVVHFVAKDEVSAIERVKTILGYIAPGREVVASDGGRRSPNPFWRNKDADIDAILPDLPSKSYDMHALIDAVCDAGSVVECQESWAQNCITAFARIDGRAVAVVANQPKVKAGCIDIDASDKMARFIRTCDSFRLPIVTFVDTPGYLPGVAQERGGIIRHGAKLLYAYGEARVCKLTVVVRKAYGGAYIAMGSKALGADRVFAFPTAEIAVMGGDAAVRIIAKKDLAQSDRPDELLRRKVEEYRATVMDPLVAAGKGYVDDIVLPSETRARLSACLMAEDDVKRSFFRHGNIPL